MDQSPAQPAELPALLRRALFAATGDLKPERLFASQLVIGLAILDLTLGPHPFVLLEMQRTNLSESLHIGEVRDEEAFMERLDDPHVANHGRFPPIRLEERPVL